ncbi:MAG TPA: hypothetical protein VH640_14705 [Bryobacteraceae bacterium]
MQINLESLRQHYRSLSDEELSALRRDELIEVAQKCYDEEWERRGFGETQESDLAEGSEEYEEAFAEDEAEPDWLEDATCVASFVSQPGGSAASDAEAARLGLQRAGIPCQISMAEVAPSTGDQPAQHEYRAMVPAPLTLKATSILDKEVFNPQLEADWRIHLESLTDAELAALNPDVICAGLFDRIARLKRVYNDEVSRRFRRSSSEP